MTIAIPGFPLAAYVTPKKIKQDLQSDREKRMRETHGNNGKMTVFFMETTSKILVKGSKVRCIHDRFALSSGV